MRHMYVLDLVTCEMNMGKESRKRVKNWLHDLVGSL